MLSKNLILKSALSGLFILLVSSQGFALAGGISAGRTPAGVASINRATASGTSPLENVETYQDFLQSNKEIIDVFKSIDRNKFNSRTEAIELIEKWNPTDENLKTYKEFWKATWKKNQTEIWTVYQDLKKSKKFIRLRLDLLKALFDFDKYETTKDFSTDAIKKEARFVLKQMRGTSEGEEFEATYLRWLQKNKFFAEICKTERKRWLTEPNLDYIELAAGLDSCPLDYEEFLSRLRRLIYAAKEFQALREIEIFQREKKLTDWEKAYLKAIYDSNVGDPVSAFQDLTKFEKDIMSSDYAENYFYISQRAGELKRSEDIINKLISNEKDKTKKRDFEFQQGFLYYQTKQYEKAYGVFNNLYKNHPQLKKKNKGKEFDQIAWLRGWTLFLDGRYDVALKAFEETRSYASDTARLTYWIAITHLKLDHETSALADFKKLALPILEHKVFSYYNLVGWIRYQDLKAKLKSSDVLQNIIVMTKTSQGVYPTPDDTISRAQMMSQYNELDDENFSTDEGDIQVINSENEVILSPELEGIQISSKAELQRQLNWAQFLIDQNEGELAKWHLYEIERKINDRKNADPLVQFYLDKKFYYRSLSLMQRIVTLSNFKTDLKNDPVLWGSLYPESYKDDVFKFTEKRKIDPYLVWSIMRAETQYKSDAISPVGALGLMQFMPYTAQKVSDLIDRKIQSQDLFQPTRSIEFGAAYLKKLSLELDYQKPLIAAAYNGGPHRVKSWLKNLGNIEYDIFIEHIPFAETRTYVKRVLTFRSMYDKLYAKNLENDKVKYLTEKIPTVLKEPFSLKEEWDMFRMDLKKTN